MRSSRVFVFTGVLAVAAAVSSVPVEIASAAPLSTTVVVPSNGATVSGTQVVLDAITSSGVTQVQFELTRWNRLGCRHCYSHVLRLVDRVG